MMRIVGLLISVMWTGAAMACPICDTNVTLDESRAACFLSVASSLLEGDKEPVVVNFISCTAEVTQKGIVDVLAPLDRSVATMEDLEFDDVAFLTKEGVECLKAAIVDPAIALPGSIPVTC